MPLGNSRDSFLDLKNLAQASTHPHRHDIVEPPTKEQVSDIIYIQENDEDLWWEPGQDLTKYERDFYPSKKKKKNLEKSCFACLMPWMQQPQRQDEEDFSDDEGDNDEALLQDAQEFENSISSPRRGGILKQSSLMVQVTPGVNKTKRQSYHPHSYHDETESHNSIHMSHGGKVHFAKPVGKVVTIQPYFCMSPQERSHVWWQVKDFNAFKVELSLLTNSKQLGGSEVWLGNSQEQEQQPVEEDNKWWHKFGHSRRGLERYLSEEQKEVEQSKRLAILKVLLEQKKQKHSVRREEEIAKVYAEHTAWSRNLALAAAASDADAVKTNFDDESRKTREYYLAKQAILSQGLSKHTPPFMVPMGLNISNNKKKKEQQQQDAKTVTVMLDKMKKRSSISKQAAGYGNSENVGSMMSAINVATRGSPTSPVNLDK